MRLKSFRRERRQVRGRPFDFLRHDELLRNPIVGIAGCCARVASGQAGALSSNVMNSAPHSKCAPISYGLGKERGGELQPCIIRTQCSLRSTPTSIPLRHISSRGSNFLAESSAALSRFQRCSRRGDRGSRERLIRRIIHRVEGLLLALQGHDPPQLTATGATTAWDRLPMTDPAITPTVLLFVETGLACGEAGSSTGLGSLTSNAAKGVRKPKSASRPCPHDGRHLFLGRYAHVRQTAAAALAGSIRDSGCTHLAGH